MPDANQPDEAIGTADAGGAVGYQPPKLSIYESEMLVAWAGDASPSPAPDDSLKATPDTGATPEVLGWSAPQPPYEYSDPALFAAPKDPRRRVSRPKKVPQKTQKPGRKTLAHATKTKLTGHDAFGGAVCTCDLVCSCNLVCTCESVAACSCVAHTTPGGAPSCSCHPVCTCQGVSTCSCVSHTSPCSPVCAVEPG